MRKTSALLAITLLVSAAPVLAAVAEGTLYEEAAARQEERLIIAQPIGGQTNKQWFDYRINVTEAQKELASDLRHSTDTEDLRDAWDEYRVELRHERRDYVKKMAKRGFTYGQVYVGE